ncbi:hypothetical protein [Pedobacter mucosus]|uniref:hypothetical protein n=1 Tax=Pedobacter mucosus TaxID=2895286 RepID=UPI001EE3E2A5|nr:hypothetical protein [Pedobacter mucosus]UKT63041.1 hypothetical protein LOK61_14840 [Pedobacter mucosus]
MHKILLVFALFLSNLAVRSQSNDNTLLEEKFQFFSKKHSSSTLFLHIDKSVYTNNEKIWFAAYLIDTAQNQASHNLLSVFLAGENNRKIELDGKFKIEYGVSSGSLRLPDTIPPGSYRLLSYTNVLDNSGSPVAQFSAPIEIKSITQQSFSSQLTLLDSIPLNGILRVKTSVQGKDGLVFNKKNYPVVSYSASKDYMRSAILKSNDLIIEVPVEVLKQSKPTLLAKVSFGNQVQHLSIGLPEIEKKRIDIKFFPEGGNLSNGLPGHVAWEAKTAHGSPIAVTGLLFKGGEIIDTVETNSYGMGSFQLTPDAESVYSLKIRSGGFLLKDTVFALPISRLKDVQLHLPEAVVNDTLAVQIYSHQGRPVQIIIHNYNKDYAIFGTPSLPNLGKMRLPLEGLAKGLSTITILDEEGRPLAERLFFAHYDKSISTLVYTEKATYGRNDTVKVKIKMADHLEKPIQGMFSVAVVQESRIRVNFSDIETAVYLNHNLGKLPPDPLGKGFRNKDYLENMLLIKGWRRYTWQDLMSTKAEDTIQLHQTLELKGHVKMRNKALKEPVKVLATSTDGIVIIESNNDGSLNLHADQLLARNGSRISLMVNGTNEQRYQVYVDDPFIPMNNRLAQQLESSYTNTVTDHSSTSVQELKGLQHSIGLQTVNIKASKRNGSINGYYGEPGPNACGDYVDEFNYLNWPYSEKRYKPEIGKLYLKRTNLEGSFFKVEGVYYTGCTTEHKVAGFVMNGIASGKEYYDTEEEKSNNPLRSTIHWQSGLSTDAAGEAELKFAAGALTDNFRIVVQGITTDNLISGYGTVTFK